MKIFDSFKKAFFYLKIHKGREMRKYKVIPCKRIEKIGGKEVELRMGYVIVKKEKI